MMLANRLWVLGALDLEMRVVESILRECGEDYCFAVSESDGVRSVSFDEARSGRWVLPTGVDGGRDVELVLVNLNPSPIFRLGKPCVVLGNSTGVDLGYPSLYQVCTYLLGGMRALMVGAASHDIARAYAVFGEELLPVRAESLGLGEADIAEAVAYVDEAVRVGDVLLNESVVPNDLVWDVAFERGWSAVFRVRGDLESLAVYKLGGVFDLELAEVLMDAARRAGYWTDFAPESRRASFRVWVSDDFDLELFVRSALGG